MLQVTSSLISGKIQVVAEAANWATNVSTVDPGYFEVRDWAVESGRAFEADEAKTVRRLRFWARRWRSNYSLTLSRSATRSGSRTCRLE
jgi:hypothetical protein